MALVSPYDTALIHEFSRREAVRLLTDFSQAKPNSNTQSTDSALDTFFASLPEDGNATQGVDDDVPSVHACAVHLELLETFMALRRKVLNSNALDVTFGISHNPNERTSLAKRREEKWDKFVNLSVARFAIWINHIHKVSKTVQQLSSPLPPLDILMVLHAFMMNPAYDTWSDRGFAAAMCTWSFPWKLIHDTLDVYSGAYKQNYSNPSLDKILHPDLFTFLQGIKKMEKCTKDHLKKPTSKHETLSLVKITDKREAKLITCYSGTLPKVTKPLHEIELAADVRFQTKFVDKMCHMLWLRSPSFVYTLTSARTRYQNFFHLLDSQNASSVSALIPTLDIDLVWRTHFLSFARYHKFCEKKRHGYIWHWSRSTKDDEHSIEATEVLYFKKFGASYQFCQCWYCEGIRDAVLKKPPKTDEELEALMRVVAKVIAKFRVAEISRRQGVKKGPVVSQPSTVRKNYLVKTRLT